MNLHAKARRITDAASDAVQRHAASVEESIAAFLKAGAKLEDLEAVTEHGFEQHPSLRLVMRTVVRVRGQR